MNVESIIQGCSCLTPRKEYEIEGVSWMRFQQFKSPYFQYDRVLCADVFCGRGTNEVGDEIVLGSPMRMLNAFARTKNHVVPSSFWFSDIRESACLGLHEAAKSYFGIEVEASAMCAKDAINFLGDLLHMDKRLFLYLVLDPNGPKDFPKEEVIDLLRANPKRVDIVPYISATSINRCIAARNKAGVQFRNWLGQIEGFDSGFVASLVSGSRRGWIREPVPGDKQKWTMLPTFGHLIPRNDWERQGYVAINSDRGRAAIQHYCGEMR